MPSLSSLCPPPPGKFSPILCTCERGVEGREPRGEAVGHLPPEQQPATPNPCVAGLFRSSVLCCSAAAVVAAGLLKRRGAETGGTPCTPIRDPACLLHAAETAVDRVGHGESQEDVAAREHHGTRPTTRRTTPRRDDESDAPSPPSHVAVAPLRG
jgi:hypothetical protein